MDDFSFIENEEDFHVEFVANCQENDLHFVWRGSIEYAHARLTYRFRGEAMSDFRKNRIGLCVLHPDGCAGLSCIIEHVDGSREETQFPVAISPHQPMKNLRSITHEFAPRKSVTVQMVGETFEMEDQRNWTDASFKTYCTPLADPFPVPLLKGDRVEQEIVVDFSNAGSGKFEKHASIKTCEIPVSPGESNDVRIAFEPKTIGLPSIGLGASTNQRDLRPREVELLKDLSIDHLRFDLRMESNWRDEFQRATEQCRQLEVSCEVALFLTSQKKQELAKVRRAVIDSTLPVARWLVFESSRKSTSPSVIKLAKEMLGDLDAPVGAGTDAYFAELNRERPCLDHVDFTCYSLNPQVHAFDDLSLVETLPVQRTTLESARTFSDRKPLVVSPVTLRPRFNPNATGPEPATPPGGLPSQVDPRQSSLFGAIWTLGSMAHLISGGPESLTYYETIGWRGVVESAGGSPCPNKFSSVAGSVFPAYHVVREICEMKQEDALASIAQGSDPLKATGLRLWNDQEQRMLIGNLTSDQLRVRLDRHQFGSALCVRVLDETTAELAMRSPNEFRADAAEVQSIGEEFILSLAPYAYAVLRSKL